VKLASARKTAERVLGVLLALAASGAAATPKEQELFRIERSTNRNVVIYGVRLAADGSIDHANPVDAHWRLLAEDGRSEDLTWLEKQFAYGYSVEQKQEGVLLKLTAVPRRTLRIVKNGPAFQAELALGTRRTVLRRIWVQADGTVLGPHVRFIDLYETDARTGERLVERIVNH
jgi:hypothetical protein